MSVLDSMRKAFNFFLLAMGVSAPAKKPQPASKPAENSEDDQP